MAQAAELYGQRWCWAARAADTIRERLSPELRHLVGGGAPDVSVVIHGPTAVGKTTLLLTLLEVDPRHQAEVAALLKGDRSEAETSTSVPIRYRWSASPDGWEYLESNRAERLTDDGLAARLRHLRETRGFRSADPDVAPVVIGLPHRFRRPGATTALPHVVDLPGVKAQDPDERKAVRRFVQRHVPLADLVVLVVMAEKMDTLVKALSQVELDWLAWPERYRLVLTHAVTIAYGNHPEFRARTDPITAAELRAVACQQLRRSLRPNTALDDPNLRARVTRILHPVEYARSWATAPERERQVFGPAVTELMGELGAQVGLTAVDDGRYMALPRSAHAVRSYHERQLANVDERLVDAQRRRDGAADALRRRRMATRKAKEHLTETERLHELAEAAQTHSAGMTVTLAAPTAPGSTGMCQLEEQRITVRAALRSAVDRWRSGPVGRLAGQTGHPLPAVLVAESVADRALEEAHRNGNRCLDLNLIFPIVLRRCHVRLTAGWKKLEDTLEFAVRTSAADWLAATRAGLPSLAEAATAHRAALAQQSRAKRELTRTCRTVADLGVEHATRAAEAEASLAVTSTVLDEIDLQWSRHVDDLYRRIAQAPDELAAYDLMAAILLAHQCRDRITNG